MTTFKYNIGDQAWYRWDGWEIATILDRKVTEFGHLVYLTDVRPGTWINETFLHD
jgi:hypothetical protein